MKSKYNISDAEREVMEMLWKQDCWIKQSELLELFHSEGKEWKRQTLNTFLSRLEEKGLVTRVNRMVQATYTENDYNRLQMQEAVDMMYGGKISNLVLALTETESLSEEDADVLLQIVEQKRAELRKKEV